MIVGQSALSFTRFSFFFFNDTATTEIYTLSLHDALPICTPSPCRRGCARPCRDAPCRRSEEHTSELQSRFDLVCRLLLEKKNLPLHASPLLFAITRPTLIPVTLLWA